MRKTLLLILFISLFFLGCDENKAITPSGKIVKIGVLAPLSGQNNRLGHQSLLGLLAANEMDRYLDNGDEIVFEVFDTKSDFNHTSKELSHINSSKSIKAVISSMASDNTLRLKREFTTYKLPTIATLASNNNISSLDGYISQVSIDNTTQVLIASHYIKDEKFIQNTGVIYDKNSVYSIEIANKFKEYYTKLGGKVKFFINTNTEVGLKEFENRDKTDIKIIFNALNAVQTIRILKIIQKQDSSFKILGTTGLLSGALELSKDDLKYFDGMYVMEHFAHDTNINKKRTILESHLDKNGFKESSYAFLSYDSYQLLVSALNGCPQYENECINTIFKNSEIIHSALGNFSMINSKVKREIYIDKIKGSSLFQDVVIY